MNFSVKLLYNFKLNILFVYKFGCCTYFLAVRNTRFGVYLHVLKCNIIISIVIRTYCVHIEKINSATYV